MPTINMLYERSVKVTDKVQIMIPSVGEILSCEDEYYSMVFALTAMPIDMMVQLDDAGIDFTTINEYDLFLIMLYALRDQSKLSLVFGDTKISSFRSALDSRGNTVLLAEDGQVAIDRVVYGAIADILRKIHNLEKKIQKPGNDEAKKYMIERARKKQKRAAKQKKASELEGLIIALVNSKEFKYNYEEAQDLQIYKFNSSVSQIVRRVNYDNLMYGCYTGNVDIKKVSQKDMRWLL